MSNGYKWMYFISCVLLLQQVTARTVLHRSTSIDSNGEKITKTWTTHETDDDFPDFEDADDSNYQTFTRNGVTLRIKPSTKIIRIGGTNVSPEQLLEQVGRTQDLELPAVHQLLRTKQPVVHTSYKNGLKHTNTYKLAPDGSIVCKTVADVDMKMVDKQFEDIFKRQREQNNANKIADWEWAKEDKPKLAPTTAQIPKAAQPSTFPQPSKPQQSIDPAKTVISTPLQPFATNHPQPTFSRYPKLPESWDQNVWDHDDPFNPPELPTFSGFDDNFDDFDNLNDPLDEPPATPEQISTTTIRTSNTNDNTARTTYALEPNKWKDNSVKPPTNSQPKQTTPHTNTKTLPSLEDFLKFQYNPSPSPEHQVPPDSTTPKPYNNIKPLTTINIEDLPPLAVLNSDKPVEEQILHPLGPSDQKPIKTLKIENIQPSFDRSEPIERTKVKTITKTIHGNQVPTAADLDPNMLEMLQRAGIKPEEILNSKGQSITKTRVEPDGRVVKTTYRVRPTYGNNQAAIPMESPLSASIPMHPDPRFPEHNTYAQDKPSFVYAPSTRHHSASHFGVDFTPFAAKPFGSTTTTLKPAARDREPLEFEGDTVAVTLNPLLIHPVHPASTHSLEGTAVAKPTNFKSPIAEFLAKIGFTMDDLLVQNGQLVKTIIDDDGHVLTARFVLTGPVSQKYVTKH